MMPMCSFFSVSLYRTSIRKSGIFLKAPINTEEMLCGSGEKRAWIKANRNGLNIILFPLLDSF